MIFNEWQRICQWMMCDCFHQPFLLCTTFRCFLCIAHYFFVHFQQKSQLTNYVLITYYLQRNVTKKWPFNKVFSVRNLNVLKYNVIDVIKKRNYNEQINNLIVTETKTKLTCDIISIPQKPLSERGQSYIIEGSLK